jgi:hypothetical protein
MYGEYQGRPLTAETIYFDLKNSTPRSLHCNGFRGVPASDGDTFVGK